MPLLSETPSGLYCQQGGFYVDPWRSVDRAVVTHAHADHARWGCKRYLASKAGESIFRMRLGSQADFDFVGYGEPRMFNGVKVSLHPAGHMTGSAQVKIEYRGEVTVVSGDYKLQSDPTCASFEPIRCHTFITESTFGLPIYQWDDSGKVFAEINRWWRENQSKNVCSVLFGYSVGKAQRLLAGLDSNLGTIYAHGAILKACEAYSQCGVQLPALLSPMGLDKKIDFGQSLVIAPPSARGGTWLRRFGTVSMAMASGWMQVRGIRRRRVIDRGFVISDHVDWPGLIKAIEATEAESVWVTHGYTRQVTSWLNRNGWNARQVATQFRGEPSGDDTVIAGSTDVEDVSSKASDGSGSHERV